MPSFADTNKIINFISKQHSGFIDAVQIAGGVVKITAKPNPGVDDKEGYKTQLKQIMNELGLSKSKNNFHDAPGKPYFYVNKADLMAGIDKALTQQESAKAIASFKSRVPKEETEVDEPSSTPSIK
jgi:hypothetical protein